MMKLVEGETKIRVEWDDKFSADYVFMGYGIAPLDYAFQTGFMLLSPLEGDVKILAANLKHIVTIAIVEEDK